LFWDWICTDLGIAGKVDLFDGVIVFEETLELIYSCFGQSAITEVHGYQVWESLSIHLLEKGPQMNI
jgi:hypothetical protein